MPGPGAESWHVAAMMRCGHLLMRGSGKRSGAGPLGPAAPRPLTAAYLRNAAMHYVSARSASVAMVRQTLERRAKRRLGVRALEREASALIEAAIAELLALGLLDDARFADSRAAALTRKGLPRRRIAHGLRGKGLARDIVEQAVAGDIDELAQARRYIERKRLGPWRSGGATPEARIKDLAALSRAGFGRAVAIEALAGAADEDA